MPGSGTAGWIKVAFEKGYQVLLIDQRGTGLSSQISAESLDELFKTDEEKASYLTHFRADSIVKDCEVVRKELTKDRSKEDEQRITLLGQSFGCFCITTYLSLLSHLKSMLYVSHNPIFLFFFNLVALNQFNMLISLVVYLQWLIPLIRCIELYILVS